MDIVIFIDTWRLLVALFYGRLALYLFWMVLSIYGRAFQTIPYKKIEALMILPRKLYQQRGSHDIVQKDNGVMCMKARVTKEQTSLALKE